MVPEWAYVGAIGSLVTALGILWRSHLKTDAREQERADRIDRNNAAILKAMADGLRKAEPK